MTIKHTPGPWTVEDDGGGPYIMAGKEDIVSGVAPWKDDDKAHANAQLIAAAPDLLEALKGLIRGSCFCECGIDNPMMRGKHSSACIAAQAAIAKAEGRQ